MTKNLSENAGDFATTTEVAFDNSASRKRDAPVFLAKVSGLSYTRTWFLIQDVKMQTLPCPNCGKPLVVSKISMEKSKIKKNSKRSIIQCLHCKLSLRDAINKKIKAAAP